MEMVSTSSIRIEPNYLFIHFSRPTHIVQHMLAKKLLLNVYVWKLKQQVYVMSNIPCLLQFGLFKLF